MTDTVSKGTFAAALDERRNSDPVIVPHVIAGKHYLDGPLIEREDPTDPTRVVTGCHDAPAELVQLAVDTSRAAQREWETVPLAERAARVRRGIDYIIANTEDWALRIALEIGKAEGPARAEAAETLEFARHYPDFADAPGAWSEDQLTATDLAVESVLRPYGVFAAITPFNYPIALSAGPGIAAVLAGNGVVIKTSHQAPWSGQAAYELFEAMDLPTGLVNVVHGADEPGKALVASDVDGISFVGSAEAGASIIRQVAAGPYMRPVIAEMGGKNPVIVTDTADLEAAADGIVFSAFDLAGQKCSALSRVLVTPGAHDRLVALVAERAKDVHMGDPADPNSYAGPLISAEAVQRYDRVVAAAREAGLDVVGGQRADDGSYVVDPVVISGLAEDHDLARTEHFLPLVTISKVASFEAALDAANAVPLGLTAGIYTGDKQEARTFLRRIEAGCINVNIPGHATTGWWPGNHTFGGWKGSGSTGKQAYGKWYVQQFAREQSRKVSPELKELLAD
ncbi:aldehyde dehydrogenase family protein [Mycobacterium sp. ITM-2016-00317]|uniref:aldehyde dehydrogenase family protein n=1 Tax=Mycobacterium sp. ITM-2016-00317 TaxID=2099694 RepID=UPI000D4BF6BD|nr:aldehyde dehydrogenase family protein [Mycobacterium sp. ITM-2016-00317]WNG87521.1 aldehyde dehydrogenase family protein [Mycobacterium sp. ITM-2016-00317]